MAVEFLILNGAKINAQDADGKTPLHVATVMGELYIYIYPLVLKGYCFCCCVLLVAVLTVFCVLFKLFIHRIAACLSATYSSLLILIYLLNALGLSPGGSTHLHTNNI